MQPAWAFAAALALGLPLIGVGHPAAAGAFGVGVGGGDRVLGGEEDAFCRRRPGRGAYRRSWRSRPAPFSIAPGMLEGPVGRPLVGLQETQARPVLES